MEFSKKASIKQMLFLSKQNWTHAHVLGGFDALRGLLASGVVDECRTYWHVGLFSVDDLYTLVDVGVV